MNLKEVYNNSVIGKMFSKINLCIENSYIVQSYETGDSVQSKYSESRTNKIFDNIGKKFESLGNRISKYFQESVILSSIDKAKVFNPRFLLMIILLSYAFVDFGIRNSNTGIIANIWDECLMLLSIAYIVIHKLINNNFKFRISQMGVYVLMFMGISMFMFFINSPDIPIAIEGLRAQIEYMLWFFIIINMYDNKEQIVSDLKLFVLVILLVSIYGIYQYIIGVKIPTAWVSSSETYIRTRVFSVVSSCNVLGSLLTLSIPITFSFFVQEKVMKKKIFYLISTGIMAVCLIFTFSRGAWIACFIAMLFFGLLKERRVIVLMFAAILVAPIAMPSVIERFTYMFSSDFAYRSSNGGRMGRWADAVKIGMQNPIMGKGLGRFGGAIAKNHWMQGTFFTDNYYLKVFTEMGFIGIIFFLILVYAIIVAGFKAIKSCRSDKTLNSISVGVYCGVIGVLFHNIFENIFERANMTTYFWVMFAILISMGIYNSKGYNDKESIL